MLVIGKVRSSLERQDCRKGKWRDLKHVGKTSIVYIPILYVACWQTGLASSRRPWLSDTTTLFKLAIDQLGIDEKPGD